MSTIIGSSPALLQCLHRVDAVAPTDATVLILGESGVGKELIARRIHHRSRRSEGPLVIVNCAAIPRDLFESEFFGHVKGAFSGASRDRKGRLETAHRGTLFRDELGEIPPELQGKLLRALQQMSFERVGDDQARQVDVRVIGATNRPLLDDVTSGRFRRELYYRLSTFPIEVPPLRERLEDIRKAIGRFSSNISTRRSPHSPSTPPRVWNFDLPSTL
jgi:transcriptional regulator with GAF, ATPase, and Fis domain